MKIATSELIHSILYVFEDVLPPVSDVAVTSSIENTPHSILGTVPVFRSREKFEHRMFRAQADWTLTHTSHKDTEESTIEASITLHGVTLTDQLIRLSANE
jgi:predicted amino acid racemase